MTEFDKEFDAGDFGLDEPDYYDESDPYWSGDGVAEYNNIPMEITLISVYDPDALRPAAPARKPTSDITLPRIVQGPRGERKEVQLRTDYRGVIRNSLGRYVGKVESLRQDLKIIRGKLFARVNVKATGEKGWVEID